jgi:hypothetical protein
MQQRLSNIVVLLNMVMVAGFCRLNAVSRQDADFQILIGLSGFTVGSSYKYDCF